MVFNKSLIAVAVCAIVSLCAGCTQVPSQPVHVQSPIEFIHAMAFGKTTGMQSEYTGSKEARDWAMAEHAESMARQQEQFFASMAAKQQASTGTQTAQPTATTVAKPPVASPSLR